MVTNSIFLFQYFSIICKCQKKVVSLQSEIKQNPIMPRRSNFKQVHRKVTDTQNYLELKVPVRTGWTIWDIELATALRERNIPIRWQNGFYHITAVFAYDDKHVTDLKYAFSNILADRKTMQVTLDKLDAFQSQNGREIILYLAPSDPSLELLALINDLRKAATDHGANIRPDFRMHITIGRIDARDATLEQVKQAIAAVNLPRRTYSISEVAYRYKSGHKVIESWTLDAV